jgi:hypothetical protein
MGILGAITSTIFLMTLWLYYSGQTLQPDQIAITTGLLAIAVDIWMLYVSSRKPIAKKREERNEKVK